MANPDAPTAILAHGKNWEFPIPADPADIRLSMDSRFTAVAAGILYASGVADRIIFSTGKTAGDAYPTEAGEQFGVLREHFTDQEVPDDVVIPEEDSFDSAGNIEQTRQMVDDGIISGAHILSVTYHLPRLVRLARRYELPVLGVHSSDRIVGRSRFAVPHLRDRPFYYGRALLYEARERRTIRPITRTVAQLGLEAVGTTLLTVDPNGDGVSRLVTRNLRHRKAA